MKFHWQINHFQWFLCVISVCIAGILAEDLSLTSKEIAALEKFKFTILPEIHDESYVSHFAQDDLYLLTWLRVSSMNVKVATNKLIEHLKWREVEKMDQIVDEDWADFPAKFPLYTDTFDKDGQPIAEVWASDWAVSKEVKNGDANKFYRWIMRIFEIQTRRLYKIRLEGRNVTQVNLLIDANKLGISQTCGPCIQIYTKAAVAYETNYPNLLGSAYIINVAEASEIVYSAVYPVTRGNTRKAVKGYVRKDHWLKVLDGKIDRDQRSTRFAGSIMRQ